MTTTQAEATQLAHADRAADDAIDSLLVHLTASASGLLQDRLHRIGDRRPSTLWALRELASLVDEALSAAGDRSAGMVAAPTAWTLETAPQGARAMACWGGDDADDETEWVAIGGGRYVMISPLEAAARFAENGGYSAAWLAEHGGRLTLIPVDAVPTPAATVKSAPEPAAETPADDSRGGTLGTDVARLAVLAQELDVVLRDSSAVALTASADSSRQVRALIHNSDAKESIAEQWRAIRRHWPDTAIRAWEVGTTLYIEMEPSIGDLSVEIGSNYSRTDESAEARAVLAELGVEVRP